eukprot:6184403-Pleurochrysis_carterae.AAC.3
MTKVKAAELLKAVTILGNHVPAAAALNVSACKYYGQKFTIALGRAYVEDQVQGAMWASTDHCTLRLLSEHLTSRGDAFQAAAVTSFASRLPSRLGEALST